MRVQHAKSRQDCQSQLTARSIGGVCVVGVVEQHHFDSKQLSIMTCESTFAVLNALFHRLLRKNYSMLLLSLTNRCSFDCCCWLVVLLRRSMSDPGLRALPMWSRAETESWPEVRHLERNARFIKAEFDALVKQGHLAVHPELLAEVGRWRVNTLWSGGREHESHTTLAPVTSGVWRSIELQSPRAKDMAFGLVYFSVVMPNSKLVFLFFLFFVFFALH